MNFHIIKLIHSNLEEIFIYGAIKFIDHIFGQMGGGHSVEYRTDPVVLETLERVNAQNNKLEGELNELKQSLRNLEEERQKLEDEIKRPVKELNEKINYVNNLNLKINYTNKTLLIGNKGSGKSTFLWLCKIGDKPELSLSDGTKNLVFHEHFIDTIGIVWSFESLLKLVVLLIYTEFPMILLYSQMIGLWNLLQN